MWKSDRKCEKTRSHMASGNAFHGLLCLQLYFLPINTLAAAAFENYKVTNIWIGFKTILATIYLQEETFFCQLLVWYLLLVLIWVWFIILHWFEMLWCVAYNKCSFAVAISMNHVAQIEFCCNHSKGMSVLTSEKLKNIKLCIVQWNSWPNAIWLKVIFEMVCEAAKIT